VGRILGINPCWAKGEWSISGLTVEPTAGVFCIICDVFSPVAFLIGEPGEVVAV